MAYSAAQRPRRWPLWLLAGFTLAGPLAGAAVLGWTHATWLPPLSAATARLPLFVVAGALAAGLSLLPTHAVSLVAGMVFGAVAGTAAATVAVLGAAVLAFVLCRPLVGGRAQAWLLTRPRAAAVHRALVHEGRARTTGIVALVRLSPTMPFALTNLLFAGTGIGLRVFAVATLLGLVPRVALVAFAGDGLAELDLSQGSDRTTLVFGIVATVLALVVVGRVARRALRVGADPA